MNKQSEKALAARWWWRKQKPSKDLEGVAFGYEALARVSWHRSESADGPDYPMGKPFVSLSLGERMEVGHRLEVNGGILPLKMPGIFFLTPEALAEPPPLNWTGGQWFRVPAFEFDPAHTSAADVAALVKLYVEREAKEHGVTLLKGSEGRRNKPYPWSTLELADRMLSGGKLESYDRAKALKVLTRCEDLWWLWYPGGEANPGFWNRADAQELLRRARGEGKQ